MENFIESIPVWIRVAVLITIFVICLSYNQNGVDDSDP